MLENDQEDKEIKMWALFYPKYIRKHVTYIFRIICHGVFTYLWLLSRICLCASSLCSDGTGPVSRPSSCHLGVYNQILCEQMGTAKTHY